MKDISRVVVSSDLETINENISDSFPLQAVDENGESLSASLSPQNVDLSMEVSAPDKEVSLEPSQTGEVAEGVTDYDFQLSENSATITGAQNLLDDVDSLEVPIDVTDITEPTTRNIDVQAPSQLTSNIDSVTVNITPVFEDSTTEESNGDESAPDNQAPASEENNEENENAEVEDTTTETTDSSQIEENSPEEETTTQESQEQTQTEDSQEQQDSTDEQIDSQENEEETER
ncbi:hypothetical protein KV134_06505 [Tetragenococcus halophilus]|nr:hypothetical protein KV134_06505 [Tetragenococcus halophilus]GMA43312.1 hypothetical protein GCM10025853_07690 [Tetragenococcus halophilus subsp. halophilus DSM 20339]